MSVVSRICRCTLRFSLNKIQIDQFRAQAGRGAKTLLIDKNNNSFRHVEDGIVLVVSVLADLGKTIDETYGTHLPMSTRPCKCSALLPCDDMFRISIQLQRQRANDDRGLFSIVRHLTRPRTDFQNDSCLGDGLVNLVVRAHCVGKLGKRGNVDAQP